MNLQEKTDAIKNDVTTVKKGIEMVIGRYRGLPISLLTRGNKTGLSVTINSDFDDIPETVFKQRPINLN